jgi:hypothetical protein
MTRWYQAPVAIEAFLRSRAQWQIQLERDLAASGAGDERYVLFACAGGAAQSRPHEDKTADSLRKLPDL